jgi:alkylhydroperoxidase/carboxymuconolactone decarboxylase family protein YurZ
MVDFSTCHDGPVFFHDEKTQRLDVRIWFPQIIEERSMMASIKMIKEDEATGKTAEIYQDIKDTLGIDFVPNMYKVMAAKPAYLEANWNKIKTVMGETGKLDSLTKEIIAVAVSAVMGCRY